MDEQSGMTISRKLPDSGQELFTKKQTIIAVSGPSKPHQTLMPFWEYRTLWGRESWGRRVQTKVAGSTGRMQC